jgi:hypothetical protein
LHEIPPSHHLVTIGILSDAAGKSRREKQAGKGRQDFSFFFPQAVIYYGSGVGSASYVHKM